MRIFTKYFYFITIFLDIIKEIKDISINNYFINLVNNK